MAHGQRSLTNAYTCKRCRILTVCSGGPLCGNCDYELHEEERAAARPIPGTPETWRLERIARAQRKRRSWR